MQLKDVAPSYGVALAIAFSVYFLKYLPMSLWIVLPTQVVVGVIVFFVVCYFARLDEYEEIKKIVMQYVSKMKKCN